MALSSDADFAAAKVAEAVGQRQAGLFETLIMQEHIVVRRF